ncbi:unnamed protein product [Spirodela intermedia]|uniref:Uncharacterized protein n=1 Tax=Spirodela intermedia TaxID=51605 RepID=A0ABN7ED03_SPIIN|nr:unnamed protein product [Spirodela intermedia]
MFAIFHLVFTSHSTICLMGTCSSVVKFTKKIQNDLHIHLRRKSDHKVPKTP